MLRNKRNLKIQEFKTEYSFHQPPSQIMNGKVCSLIVPFPELLLDLIITRDLLVNTVDKQEEFKVFTRVHYSSLRGCLPKSGTVVVGLKLQFFSFFVP